MAQFTKEESGLWKARVRKKGWPPIAKSFRVKRDAEDWARKTEDDMIRGAYVIRTRSSLPFTAFMKRRYFSNMSESIHRLKSLIFAIEKKAP